MPLGYEETPAFAVAAYAAHEAVVELLIGAGAAVDRTEENGYTPLWRLPGCPLGLLKGHRSWSVLWWSTHEICLFSGDLQRPTIQWFPL